MGLEFPVYEELKSIAYDTDNKLFLLGEDANEWLETAKDNLSEILASE